MPKTPYYISIGAIVKDEPHLQEWVAWNVSYRVDHIFIYDNESAEPAGDLLAKEVAEGLVTVVSIAGVAQQYPAYNDLLARFGGSTEWLWLLDGDEFPFLVGGENLAGYFKEREEFSAVTVNWQIFGSNGLLRRPAYLLPAYTRRAGKDFEVNRHYKTCFKPKEAKGGFLNCHCPIMKGVVVNEHGVELSEYNGLSPSVSVDTIQLNHYFCRSVEDQAQKRRIRADTPIERSADEIAALDCNDVEDRRAAERWLSLGLET